MKSLKNAVRKSQENWCKTLMNSLKVNLIKSTGKQKFTIEKKRKGSDQTLQFSASLFQMCGK